MTVDGGSTTRGRESMLSIAFPRGVSRNGENQIGGAFRARPPNPLRRGSETNSLQPEWSSACEEEAERVDKAHRAIGACPSRQGRDADRPEGVCEEVALSHAAIFG